MIQDPMALPPGMTCKDCHHLRRCIMLLGIPITNTTCDFSPSRFYKYQPEKPKDVKP
jgi:hypothetical protein